MNELYYDHFELNGKRKQLRDNLAQERLDKLTNLKTYNLTMQGSEWIKLIKVVDVQKNSSALVSINCYGIKDSVKTILTTSVFNVSCGLNASGEVINSVLPISQTPEIQQGGNASGGEGGSSTESGSGETSSDGGSGNNAIYGLNNIAFEKYDDNTIYVMGLISFPATDQYDSLDVEMRLDDNLNFEYLESLDVVYKQEDDTLQEGTQIYVEGDYINYYMRDSLKLISQYIGSVGTYDSGTYAFIHYRFDGGVGGENIPIYKTDADTGIVYNVCGVTATISNYFGITKDYEKFNNLETISIPIQLGVEFNLFNILKEYIDVDHINENNQGYKVKLNEYYNPGGILMDYNGLDENVFAFKISTVGMVGSTSIDESNFQLRNCNQNTPNYIITAVNDQGSNIELEGTIYLNVYMQPIFFTVDFIFNCPNQFPNGKQLEIVQVNKLPLRYMGETKVSSYSQSYELYNPYSRLDMLSNGYVINSLTSLELNKHYTRFGFGLGYVGYKGGNFVSTGESVYAFNDIVHISMNFSLYDEYAIKSGLISIIKGEVFASVDKMRYVTGGVPIPLFYAKYGAFDTTGGYGSSIINIKLQNLASDVWAYTGTIRSFDDVKRIAYYTTFAITQVNDDISSFTYTKTPFYPPDITTDDDGNVTDISIEGTSIALQSYVDEKIGDIDAILDAINGEVV